MASNCSLVVNAGCMGFSAFYFFVCHCLQLNRLEVCGMLELQ